MVIINCINYLPDKFETKLAYGYSMPICTSTYLSKCLAAFCRYKFIIILKTNLYNCLTDNLETKLAYELLELPLFLNVQLSQTDKSTI